jgi:hypothetical protein
VSTLRAQSSHTHLTSSHVSTRLQQHAGPSGQKPFSLAALVTAIVSRAAVDSKNGHVTDYRSSSTPPTALLLNHLDQHVRLLQRGVLFCPGVDAPCFTVSPSNTSLAYAPVFLVTRGGTPAD